MSTEHAQPAAGPPQKTAWKTWSQGDRCPALEPEAVHCWLVDLDDTSWPLHTLYLSLSAPEQQRVEQFLVPRELERFIVRRGWLRLMLAAYLGVKPEALAFDYGTHGKPSIAYPQSSGISFSVTHSGGLMLAAFAGPAEVGIDLERIRDDWPFEQLAAGVPAVLSGEEARSLADLSPAAARRRFFTYWVRKEALLKAAGLGLTGASPAGISVVDRETGDMQIIDLGPKAYRLIDLAVDNEHRAALAVCADSPPPVLHCFKWSSRSRSSKQ